LNVCLGKSSLLQALFRMVELHSGTIEVDGVDISKIGLASLRAKLALVPQDSTLFVSVTHVHVELFSFLLARNFA
jgi:ATP-binding cassette subfamily C (CFTR/MRP) protein 1